ncbi:hypothetical protein B0H10DRAFT_2282870, partial [Mycena sp. CBHHK59/15]
CVCRSCRWSRSWSWSWSWLWSWLKWLTLSAIPVRILCWWFTSGCSAASRLATPSSSLSSSAELLEESEVHLPPSPENHAFQHLLTCRGPAIPTVMANRSPGRLQLNPPASETLCIMRPFPAKSTPWNDRFFIVSQMLNRQAAPERCIWPGGPLGKI